MTKKVKKYLLIITWLEPANFCPLKIIPIATSRNLGFLRIICLS